MNLSIREIALAWATMAAFLGAVTYFVGDSKLQEWKDIGAARENTEREIALNERLISQRETFQQRLDATLQHIDTHPPGFKVTPQLLESIEQLARQHDLRLESLSPDEEKSLGDIYEVAIKCNWAGGLESLVRFLYALRAEGGKYKVRSLTIAPTGQSGQLRGAFTVDCAYTRAAGEAEPPPLQVTPAAAP